MSEKYPLALNEGTILAGQYVIEKILGQGGFGITYKASVYITGEKVAIKEFFPDTMATRQGTIVMPSSGEKGSSFAYGKNCFLEEAKTLAQFIGVEGIVRIHTYFEENKTAYFVMDYVEGVSFDEYIKANGGKIPYETAEGILIKVIDALSVVHKKGIVHRDVTPDNIYLTNDGKVKLLDFGAARYSLGDKSRSLDVVLKHGFAPKEQYTRHGKQGPFTDVYTVGASFYFAITGKKPPDSIDRLEEDDIVAPSVLGIDIPQKKEEVILKALSVQPQDRFQTMEEFRNALYGNMYQQDILVDYTNTYTVDMKSQMTGNPYNQYGYNMEEYNAYNQYGYGEKQKNSKKWLIPVISGLCILALLVVVLIVALDRKNQDKDEKTAAGITTQATIDNTAENTTGNVTENIVDNTTEGTSCVVRGSFDTYHVNNISNGGILDYNNNLILAVHPNGLFCFGDEDLVLDTGAISSVNIVDRDRIVYIKDESGLREAYITDAGGSKCNKLDCLNGIDTLKSIVANENGLFYAYEDTTEDMDFLNYVTWEGDIPDYYYPYTPYTFTIIGEYAYWVDGTGKSIRCMELSKYGSSEADKLYSMDFDAVIMVGEGDYLYIVGGNEGVSNGKIGRYTISTGEFIFCEEAQGKTDNNYISGIDIYNGKLYYSLTSWDTSESSIWRLDTTDLGWTEDDYTCIWESGESQMVIYSLCNGNDMLYFRGTDHTNADEKSFAAFLSLNTNEAEFFYYTDN